VTRRGREKEERRRTSTLQHLARSMPHFVRNVSKSFNCLCRLYIDTLNAGVCLAFIVLYSSLYLRKRKRFGDGPFFIFISTVIRYRCRYSFVVKSNIDKKICSARHSKHARPGTGTLEVNRTLPPTNDFGPFDLDL